MRRTLPRVSGESGFSLVELLMAILVLVVGAGGAFALIDSANRSVTFNSSRVGATNLARELTEYARTTDYDLLQPDQIVTGLRKHSSIAGAMTGGNGRSSAGPCRTRSAPDVCTFDDPKDGLATQAPTNACSAVAAVPNAPAESNPDDFRRVTYTLSWNARGRPGSVTQTALIVNPSGGLGPRITKFGEPTAQVTGDSWTWGPSSLTPLESTPAASVHWTTDDGTSGGINSGDATGGQTVWTFTWNFGTAFSTSSPWVRDGSYTVQVQGFSTQGVPGEAVLKTIHINRHVPGTVSGFIGGYNASRNVVDMRWNPYDERDLQGYIVVREADGKQICPASGSVQQGLSCTDLHPLAAGSRYTLVATDCVDLKNGVNCTRPGVPAYIGPILGTGGTATSEPTGLAATVVDGKPTLTWTAPAGTIRFYRIYRADKGTNVQDRYDETNTNQPTYADPNPGTASEHTYWVTAVDQSFNESPLSAPITVQLP